MLSRFLTRTVMPLACHAPRVMVAQPHKSFSTNQSSNQPPKEKIDFGFQQVDYDEK